MAVLHATDPGWTQANQMMMMTMMMTENIHMVLTTCYVLK